MGLCMYIYLYFYILPPCLCSFLACHPYISFQIFSFPVSICMPHFLNKLLWILCLATHWEWVWLFCVVVNIANMDLLHSFHGEGAWSFCVPCLRTVYLSFRASGIKMCTPGYPAVVACLCLQVWSKYAQIHMLLLFFFFFQERNNHAPSPWYAAIMRYGYVQMWKPGVTGHLNGSYRDQHSSWRHRTSSGQYWDKDQ